MWLQVDNEFQQVKIKELNEMNNLSYKCTCNKKIEKCS